MGKNGQLPDTRNHKKKTNNVRSAVVVFNTCTMLSGGGEGGFLKVLHKDVICTDPRHEGLKNMFMHFSGLLDTCTSYVIATSFFHAS